MFRFPDLVLKISFFLIVSAHAALGVLHTRYAPTASHKYTLQGVRIVLLIAVGYFEADRRSVPDAQRPGLVSATLPKAALL